MYKECLHCATTKHGPICVAEFVDYNLDMSNGPVCMVSSRVSKFWLNNQNFDQNGNFG